MLRALKAVGRIIASALLGIVVFWAGWMAAVVIWSSIDQARPAGAIVVLGAAQYDGEPSPVLKARLDHALDLWRDGYADVLVVTGGRRPASCGRRASPTSCWCPTRTTRCASGPSPTRSAWTPTSRPPGRAPRPG